MSNTLQTFARYDSRLPRRNAEAHCAQRYTLAGKAQAASRWRLHALQSRLEDAAVGFVAEYDLAGIEIDNVARSQLQNWYLTELQRTGFAAANSGPSPGEPFKELPPLLQTRPGVPKITLLWDLESVKPFTQQNRTQPEGAAATTNNSSGGGAQVAQPQSQTAGGRSSNSRASRAAAAGLTGAATATPDLVGALDQLCRTLKVYGNIHAAHLFLRESTLSKAPALQRQVEQLCSWVVGEGEGEGEPSDRGEEGVAHQEQGDRTDKESGTGQQTAAAARKATSSATPDTAGLRPSTVSGSATLPAAARRRPRGTLSAVPRPSPHGCPLCRSNHPSRLALLAHFATVHQAPLLAATAADPRTHIMWTRGRPVTLPAGSGLGNLPPKAATDSNGSAASGGGDGDDHQSMALSQSSISPEPVPLSQVLLNPQDFVFAREQLMRGSQLDPLLEAAPVTTARIGAAGVQGPAVGTAPSAVTAAAGRAAGNLATTLGGAKAAVAVGPRGRAVRPSQERSAGSGLAGQGAGLDPNSDSPRESWSALGRPGLHLHLVAPGEGAEDVSGALVRLAGQMAEAAQARSDPSSPRQRRQGQRAGQGAQTARGRGRNSEVLEQTPLVCLCVVSDMEGLDKTLANLQRQGVLAMAVTRVSRVPAADVSLRWWAVQGGEYRLKRATLR